MENIDTALYDPVKVSQEGWDAYESSREELDCNNWLIHQLFTSQRFDDCLNLIDNQLGYAVELSYFPLFVKGLIQRHRGKLQLSLNAFQKLALLDPARISVLKQLAVSLILLGRHAKAIAFLSKTLDYAGKDKDIYCLLGEAYMQLSKKEEAAKYFCESLKVGKAEKAYLKYGSSLEQESSDLAAGVYFEGIEANPESDDLLMALGRLHLSRGERDQAAAIFCKILERQPLNYDCRFACGATIQDTGDFDTALLQYRVCATRQPTSPELWNNIGACFAQRRKSIIAVSCLQHALYLNPLCFKVLYNLGLCYLQLNQNSSAFVFLEAAAKRDPSSATSFAWLGVALARLDNTQMAEQAFIKALQLSTNNQLSPAHLHCNYAIVLKSRQKQSEALKHYNIYKDHLNETRQQLDSNLETFFI